MFSSNYQLSNQKLTHFVIEYGFNTNVLTVNNITLCKNGEKYFVHYHMISPKVFM